MQQTILCSCPVQLSTDAALSVFYWKLTLGYVPFKRETFLQSPDHMNDLHVVSIRRVALREERASL